MVADVAGEVIPVVVFHLEELSIVAELYVDPVLNILVILRF